MSAPLLAAALALLASVPLAGVSRLGGAVVERLTAAPDVRERAWTFLFLLPLAMTVAAVSLAASGGAPQFDSPSAAFEPVLVIVRETAAAPSSAADLALGQAAAPLAAPLLGAAGLGLLARVAAGVHARRRLGRVVARARPCADPALLAALAHEARRRRLGAPPLLISDEVDRPLLAGVRRPVILLPAALARSCSTERLQLICAHELAHLARRDPWRLLGEEAVAGLFWFNPFLPPVRARMSAAREEVCDAQALAGAPAPARRAYAETLVHALRLGAGPEPAFTGAARSTAMRLQAILTPARPARAPAVAGAAALSALLLSAAGAGSLAMAQVAETVGATAPSAARPATVARTPTPAAIPQPPTPPEAVQGPRAPAKTPIAGGWSPNRRSAVVPPVDSPRPKHLLAVVPPVEVQLAAMQQAPKPAPAPRRSFACPAGSICVLADTFQEKPGNPRVYTYSGHPQIMGVVTVGSDRFQMDGGPLPSGFDAGSIDPATIARIEVTSYTADGRPETANTDPKTVRTTINFISKAAAGGG